MLNDKLYFEGLVLHNRVVFQPMEGCDCTTDGSPTEFTRKKYLNNARSGAGLIWIEASAVCPEGRTSTRQLCITKENVGIYKEFIQQIKTEGKKANGFEPVVIIQLTHSGRQSIVPMIAYRHPLYDPKRNVDDSNIVTDEYLDTIPEMYVNNSLLAYEAGVDGVDIKSCHGYLFQELLSAYSRPGRYGGSFENRSRLLIDCVEAVTNAIQKIQNRPFIISSRLGVSDMVAKPYGFGTDENNNIDLRESVMLIEKLRSKGLKMINITIGNPYYNPHINRPFRKGGYIPPEKPETGLQRFYDVQKYLKEKFPDIIFVGSAFSYYGKDMLQEAERQLENKVCDLAGFGRVTLAYPSFYSDHLKGQYEPKKTCVLCSKCTELMRAGEISGCAVFNEYYRELYKEKILCRK